MPLIAPEVVGPASVCSKQVRVRGHIAGATITIRVNGDSTSSQLSSLNDDFIDVGVELEAGDRITAIQNFENDESPESPFAVEVQAAAESLSHLTFVTNLHPCGTAVWAEGTVPGTKIVATIGNTEVGSVQAVNGVARLIYQPGLTETQKLNLTQSTCNGLSKTTTSQLPEPVAPPLPRPRIHQPLLECMTSLTISDIVDGATVTVYRDGERVAQAPFDRSSLTWPGFAPLVDGEVVEVEQSFTCRKRGEAGPGKPTIISKRAKAKVGSADDLLKPRILSPICPRPTLITITDLVPGARVILYNKGQPVGMTDAPERTYSFPAPALGKDARLTARMALCGREGPLSDEVKVKADEPIDDLTVSTLYECAAYIFIRNYTALEDGKIVHARNSAGEAISAYHQIYTRFFLLPVSPALVADDEVTILVRGCDGEDRKFGPHPVLKARQLPPPEVIAPVTEGEGIVRVLSKYAGALIKVYVDGELHGQGFSWGDQSTTTIWISAPLELGQQVRASHALCSVPSKLSNPETVVIPPPHVPELIKPANTTQGVSTTPDFVWRDPGADTSAAATQYRLRVRDINNALVVDETTPTTSLGLITALPHEQPFFWSIEASNSTGATSSLGFSFVTKPAPEPPEPDPGAQAVLLFASDLFPSHDGITWAQPRPDEAFSFYVVVGNAGEATSEEQKVLFDVSDSQGFISSEVMTLSPLAPAATRLLEFPISPMPAGQYQFVATLIVANVAVDQRTYGAWIGF